MEEEDEEGTLTPPLAQGIGGVERRGFVDIVRQEDHTPSATIAIGGLTVNMNVEGQRENFYDQTLQREGGATGSSEGGSVVPASPMSFSPGAIVGLTFCNRRSTIHRSNISAGRARRRTTVKGQTWWEFIQT